MKIGQYCQRQRCRHAELKQFRQAFASRGFVSDSWAFLFYFPVMCVGLSCSKATNWCQASKHHTVLWLSLSAYGTTSM